MFEEDALTCKSTYQTQKKMQWFQGVVTVKVMKRIRSGTKDKLVDKAENKIYIVAIHVYTVLSMIYLSDIKTPELNNIA